jgi:hypothetical protein
VLDAVRAQGKTVTIMCQIVRIFIEENPEYADLIDPEHPGVATDLTQRMVATVEPAGDAETVTVQSCLGTLRLRTAATNRPRHSGLPGAPAGLNSRHVRAERRHAQGVGRSRR